MHLSWRLDSSVENGVQRSDCGPGQDGGKIRRCSECDPTCKRTTRDWIKPHDIGFRATRIRTFDHESVTVPNTELATTAVTNRMRNDQLRISYVFGVGYGDDPDRAIGVLRSVAADHDGVPTDPDREDVSAVRSEYIREGNERCEAAGIDLSTTSQHALSGTIGLEGTPAG
jgi:hypothetical protein